jgi:hypothetical protein
VETSRAPQLATGRRLPLLCEADGQIPRSCPS